MSLENLIANSEAKSQTYFFKKDSFQIINDEMIQWLENIANKEKSTVRICMHPNSEEQLHNMIISHYKGNYIRPHANFQKAKTYQILNGSVLMIFLDENANEINRITLDEKESKICRVEKGTFILLIPLTTIVTFHEIALGPFLRDKDTIFADWSPSSGTKEIDLFLNNYGVSL